MAELIYNKSTDPKFNLAAEETLLNLKTECVMFWRNSPSVIIGVNQNAYREVNLDYAQKNGVKVLRRITGGGAVYHNLGNINYSIVTKSGKLTDYQSFCEPIILALKSMGINAEFSGRNDIAVEGKKISGSAEIKKDGVILHHGTLIFKMDAEEMSKVLTPSKLKFIGKSVNSVSKRVGNLADYVKIPTAEEFISSLLENFGVSCRDLSAKEKEIAEKLRCEKYDTDDWNYGEKSKFATVYGAKFPFGEVNIGLAVTGGRIEKIAVSGDFFGEKSVRELETALIGVNYLKTAIIDRLEQIDINFYINKMTAKQFAELAVGEINEL